MQAVHHKVYHIQNLTSLHPAPDNILLALWFKREINSFMRDTFSIILLLLYSVPDFSMFLFRMVSAHAIYRQGANQVQYS